MHDRDIHGNDWAPCPACPHATPGSCPSRRHRALCVRVANNPATWGPKVAAQPAEDRPPREGPPSPLPFVSPFRRVAGKINVGFAGPWYGHAGGTNTWHAILLPRLAAMPDLHVLGYAIGGVFTGPPMPGVTLAQGSAAVRAILAASDVAVVWGLPDLAGYLDGLPRRPKLIGVSHASSYDQDGLACTRGMSPYLDLRIGVSPEAARAWEGAPPGTVHVVYNGVDPDDVRPTRGRDEVRAELGLAPGDVAVLAASRLCGIKRVELLAEAVARLGPPYRLIVAGDGETRAAVIAAGEGRATVLGVRRDVPDLMAACDLFALASTTEGAAFVLAEAMAAEIPIIATPVGLFTEEHDYARIVPVSAGAAEWADAIAEDWDNIRARSLRVMRAADAVRDRFSARAMADGMAGLIRSLMPAEPETTMGPAPSREPTPPSAGLRVRHDDTPPTAGRQAVAAMERAKSCPGRRELTPEERRGCGCNGRVMAVCLAGKSRRDDQRVSLAECVACVGAGSG